MDCIYEFIKQYDTDQVENSLSYDEIKNIFAEISFVPGEQLMIFLNSFSYLACGDVEFFGINDELREKSYLFEKTAFLLNEKIIPCGYYVVEYKGDGIYVLTDEEDNIFNFYLGDSKAPEAVEMKFFDYVLKRLEEAE